MLDPRKSLKQMRASDVGTRSRKHVDILSQQFLILCSLLRWDVVHLDGPNHLVVCLELLALLCGKVVAVLHGLDDAEGLGQCLLGVLVKWAVVERVYGDVLVQAFIVDRLHVQCVDVHTVAVLVRRRLVVPVGLPVGDGVVGVDVDGLVAVLQDGNDHVIHVAFQLDLDV